MIDESGHEELAYKAGRLWAERRAVIDTPAEKYLRNVWQIERAPAAVFGWLPGPDAMISPIHNAAGFVIALVVLALNAKGHPQRIFGDNPCYLYGAPLETNCCRLAKPGRTLGLAVMAEQAVIAQRRYSLPFWATISTRRIFTVDLPDGIERVLFFDGETIHECRTRTWLQDEDEARRVSAVLSI